MFEFEYTFDDLFEYACNLEKINGFTREGNTITYPNNIATGHSSFHWLNDFISFQIVNYTAQTQLFFKRKATSQNNIIINFQDFTFTSYNQHYTTNEIVANNNGVGSVQCKSTKVAETVILEPGTIIKVVLVFLKDGWVDKVLLDNINKEKFYKYLVSSDANIRKEYLTAEQHKLIDEILDKSQNTKLQNLYNESRILQLLESFLTEILEKDDEGVSAFTCSKEDIKKIKLAENYIINNIEQPFIGVDYLAKLSCMSRTKFIGLFQKLYGISSYECFQKERLSLAYNYIISGEFQIGEIAERIGYRSSNNFTIAFKKKYGLFPKELIQNVKSN
jgi:AraC-like DNA-binding protein